MSVFLYSIKSWKLGVRGSVPMENVLKIQMTQEGPHLIWQLKLSLPSS